MSGKYLVGAVIEAVIKVIVVAALVMFVFRASTAAYEFGYKVFADKPMSSSEGRTITVGIAESASVQDIAQMLQEKGLIEDARLFVIQELLSAYHGEIIPGIYDLSTSMTADEMLAVMSTPAEETSAVNNQSGDSEEAGEEDANTETGLEDEGADDESMEGMVTE